MTPSDHRPKPVADPADFPNDTTEESTHKLIDQGTVLVEEVRQLRKAVDRQRRVQFWAIVVGLMVATVGAILISVLAVISVDNNEKINELKHQLCGAVVGIVPAPDEAPPPPGPQGDRARDVINRFRVLARDFNCTLR